MSEYNLFLNGSNFKTGFSAGRVQIPTESSSGVPVGLPIPYVIKSPLIKQDIYTTETLKFNTPGIKVFLPLTQFTAGKVVDVDSTNKMLMFDYARVVSAKINSISETANINIYASYYDMYGNIGFNLTTLNSAGPSTPLIPVLGLASIYLTCDSESEIDVDLTFTLEDIFELPITDNGVKSQLLLFTRLEFGDGENQLGIITSNDLEPYQFQWDGNYTLAATTPSVLLDSQPRPWFQPTNQGLPYGAELRNYTFAFQQNVFGLGFGTQFNIDVDVPDEEKLPDIPSQTLETKYVFGVANYTEGFTPWQG